MVNRFFKTLFCKVFPSHCLLCLQPSRRQLSLCEPCQGDLPWLTRHCRQCALPLADAGDDERCGQCLSLPPAFSRCLCPLRYDFPVNHLVTGFKYHRQFANGALLAELWLQRWATPLEQPPELIVPVPLHWRRRLHRGYNQAELVARHWSLALDIPMATPLQRRRATAAQQGLSAQDRQHNLHDAFVLRQAKLVAGKHIALVDDVLTTGATARNVAAILARGGARQVDIWCLARTP